MQKVSTRKDVVLNSVDAKAMLHKKSDSNMQIMRDLSHFTKKSAKAGTQ